MPRGTSAPPGVLLRVRSDAKVEHDLPLKSFVLNQEAKRGGVHLLAPLCLCQNGRVEEECHRPRDACSIVNHLDLDSRLSIGYVYRNHVGCRYSANLEPNKFSDKIYWLIQTVYVLEVRTGY
ncbi:hypothetical protein V2G26_003142 [Clonostachys chloroleuca]